MGARRFGWSALALDMLTPSAAVARSGIPAARIPPVVPPPLSLPALIGPGRRPSRDAHNAAATPSWERGPMGPYGLDVSAVDVLGPVAACVGSAMAMSPLLQALRVWQTRSSRDVSLAAMVIFVANSCAWTAYGWAKGDAVVVIPNLIALVCLSLAIGVVVRFRRPLASDLEVAAADAGADAESALVSEARPA